MSALLTSELILRLTVFVGALVLMAAAEVFWPRRKLVLGRRARWPTNLGMVALGALVIRLLAAAATVLLVPLVAVTAAVLAAQHDWGLLNAVSWPQWIEIAIALAFLDFAIWLQHLLAHRVPLLWRLHRVHHADRDIDVTTALRFHPIEIRLSMIYKVGWVVVLGAPLEAVIAFELILNAVAMFNHANVALPSGLERPLRALIVTPDMHRIHHSIHASEHHANFGFNLSVWDRLFATYVAEPRDGHREMTIGLPEFQTDRPARLGWCLGLPFRRRF